ncbi:MAG: hypothetical protein KDC85_05335 [Saprospiraceae bacterium]|nr:hypothetical protein [Saprospiraceae bacterium]MCB9324978.1 hypothetical protein [Lewinellaceae bacterium]
MANDASKIEWKEEKLVFIQHSLPTMLAGKYHFTADVTGIEDKNGAAVGGLEGNSQTFHVDAPRFTLDVGGIYAVYPPDGHYGHVKTSLPHIVFNRRTLPWERTIDGQLAKDAANPIPWMALLLLSEKEILENKEKPIKIQTGSLSDLEVKQDNIKRPALTLNPWEKVDLSQPCQYIDIPGALFKNIAPPLEDLPFLAHVKKVSVDQNKEAASIDDDGFFSTLICNRMPSVNQEDPDSGLHHTVFLVSLEGHQDTIEKKGELTNETSVRVVTFYQWSFTQAAGKNFKELCEDLAVNQLKYHPDLPDKENPDSPASKEKQASMAALEKNKALQKAFEYGYVPLPQHTRNGLETYAWYRGPLSPNFVPTDPRTRIYRSADKALRYDQDTGLFDASYAAAWQLGRMLALKDSLFSKDLFTWNNQYKALENTSSALNTVIHTLPGVGKEQWEKLMPKIEKQKASSDSEETEVSNDSEKQEAFIFEDLVQAFLTEKFNPGEEQVKDSPEKKTIKKLDPERPPIPQTLRNWLEDKLLLFDVPFNYLVPNEKMLKEETLANFHMDYGWIECLLDGALSIAWTSDSENLMNQVMEKGPWSRIKNQADQMAAELKEIKDKDKVISPSLNGFISGFMLRSKLISGWIGVKVFAKGVDASLEDDLDWLVPLRLERIKDDILFCLFDRKVRQIVIIQPPESMHFGLEESSKEKFLKHPRVAEKGDLLGTIDTQKKVEKIPFRNKTLKVLDIKKMAKNMQQVTGQKTFTSAQFAFHMVESPILFTLELKY